MEGLIVLATYFDRKENDATYPFQVEGPSQVVSHSGLGMSQTLGACHMETLCRISKTSKWKNSRLLTSVLVISHCYRSALDRIAGSKIISGCNLVDALEASQRLLW